MKAFDKHRLHLQTANANLLRIIGSYAVQHQELLGPLVLYAEGFTDMITVWAELETFYREL